MLSDGGPGSTLRYRTLARGRLPYRILIFLTPAITTVITRVTEDKIFWEFWNNFYFVGGGGFQVANISPISREVN